MLLGLLPLRGRRQLRLNCRGEPCPSSPNISHGRGAGAFNSPQGSRTRGGGTAEKALTQQLRLGAVSMGPLSSQADIS